MKSTSSFPFPVTRIRGLGSLAGRGGFANEPVASLSLDQCPEAVAKAIQNIQGIGRVDGIRRVRRANRSHYVAELDLPGELGRRLHIGEDGTVLRVVEEIPEGKLPKKVRRSLAPFLSNPSRSRYEDAERITTDGGTTEYHVEIDLPDDVDLHLLMDEDGVVLRRWELADF